VPPYKNFEGVIVPLTDEKLQQFGIGSRASVMQPGLPQKLD